MNTIENIWKEGFEKKQFVIPKIRNLYEKKSLDILARIERRMKNDNLLLIPFALLATVVAASFNMLWAGIYLTVILIVLFFLNRGKIAELKSINIAEDVISYLKSYRSNIIRLRNFYIRVLAIGTPAVALPAYYVYFYNDQRLYRFVEENSIFVSLTALITISVFLSGWAVFAYLVSNRILYKRLFRKLDELIEDLDSTLEES